MAHATVLLGLAVVQHYLRVGVIVILNWITQTFDARPTSRHRWVLLLRDASRWLLVYLNLLEVDRELAIAFVVDVAPFVVY